MRMTIAEWIAAIGALVGTLIVALNVSWGGWGFVVMLVFSGWLLALAIAARRWPYVALFAGYEAVNLVGVYRWLVAASNGP